MARITVRIGLGAICAALAAGGLAFARAAREPAQPSAALDKYALMEVAADFPPGFELWPEYRSSKEAGPQDFWIGRWMSTRMKPGERPSPSNQILGGAKVSALVGPSSQVALEALGNLTSSIRLQVAALPGTYSGRKIGDACYRGGSSPDRSAVLFFVRGPVCFEVYLYGTAGTTGWPAAVESVAQSLVDRVDAAVALQASGIASIAVNGSQLSGRSPNGVALVHVKEFADAAGATATVDLPGGTATITANGHKLLLHVGRKEAWLDGKQVALPFPALRDGRSQVWCPVSTLSNLTSRVTTMRVKPKRK